MIHKIGVNTVRKYMLNEYLMLLPAYRPAGRVSFEVHKAGFSPKRKKQKSHNPFSYFRFLLLL
jgi:hypothetical protein